MRKPITLFLLILVVLTSGYKKPTEEKIKWMTLAEAEAAVKLQKKPILIDLYTDWCSWCKVMDKKTYSNKQVIQYLQEKFYTVKLDAETRDHLQFNGRSYAYNPNYRTNDIAVFLTSGQLSFPTTIIIPVDGSGPQPIPGFLAPNELELIVKYFGEDKYGKVAFPQYQKSFRASW